MSRVYVSREHFQVFIFPTKYVSRKTRQYLKPLRKQNQKISLEDVKPLHAVGRYIGHIHNTQSFLSSR